MNQMALNDSQAAHIQSKYGIDEWEYEAILREQNHKCGACGTSEAGGKSRNFVVDHCHKTGIIRGLLCHKCNVGFGLLGDSWEELHDRAQYLLPYRHYYKPVKVYVIKCTTRNFQLRYREKNNNRLRNVSSGTRDPVKAEKKRVELQDLLNGESR